MLPAANNIIRRDTTEVPKQAVLDYLFIFIMVSSVVWELLLHNGRRQLQRNNTVDMSEVCLISVFEVAAMTVIN